MSDEKLKPCPFCGENSACLVTDHVCEEYSVYYVNCKGPGDLNGYCNTMGPRNFKSIDLAIEAWNTRPVEAERAKTKEKMRKAHMLRDPHLTDPEGPLYKFRMQQFEDWYEREGKDL